MRLVRHRSAGLTVGVALQSGSSWPFPHIFYFRKWYYVICKLSCFRDTDTHFAVIHIAREKVFYIAARGYSLRIKLTEKYSELLDLFDNMWHDPGPNDPGVCAIICVYYKYIFIMTHQTWALNKNWHKKRQHIYKTHTLKTRIIYTNSNIIQT